MGGIDINLTILQKITLKFFFLHLILPKLRVSKTGSSEIFQGILFSISNIIAINNSLRIQLSEKIKKEDEVELCFEGTQGKCRVGIDMCKLGRYSSMCAIGKAF